MEFASLCPSETRADKSVVAFCEYTKHQERQAIKRIRTCCYEVNLNAFKLKIRSFLVISVVRNRNIPLAEETVGKIIENDLIVYCIKV